MRTSEVLNKAADIIQDIGWTRGDWGLAYNGAVVVPVCAEGAILAAAGLGEQWMDLRREGEYAESYTLIDTCPATRAVKDYLGVRFVWDWNDDEDRTAAEVIEVLRAAAVIEQAKEQQDAPVAVSA